MTMNGGFNGNEKTSNVSSKLDIERTVRESVKKKLERVNTDRKGCKNNKEKKKKKKERSEYFRNQDKE